MHNLEAKVLSLLENHPDGLDAVEILPQLYGVVFNQQQQSELQHVLQQLMISGVVVAPGNENLLKRTIYLTKVGAYRLLLARKP